MKQLFICTTVPITLKGILTGQPKALSEHYVIALISSPDKELTIVGAEEGVPTYSVPMERGISPFKDVVSLWNMVKLLRKHKPDAVHSYTPKAGLITMLGGFITRVPVRIHTFTGLIFPTSSGLKQKILIVMDKLICACATTVVPEGEGVKNDLFKYGITNKPIKVIGNGNIAGIDTTVFSKKAVERDIASLKQQLEYADSDFVFAFVGRFTPDKGFYELIEAFESLPVNAKLLLIGTEDERLPLPRNLSQKINDNSRIQVTGWVDDVRGPLGVSDVLVLPSYREGFPNTPIQAGSMGLPCIVTDVNGSNEIITQNDNGWIIPPRDALALKASMLTAMLSKNLNMMGKNARRNVQNKYERSYYVKELKQFYQEIIK